MSSNPLTPPLYFTAWLCSYPIPRHLFVLSLLADHPISHKRSPFLLDTPLFPLLSKVLPRSCPPEVTIPPVAPSWVSVPFPSVASHCALSRSSGEHRLGSQSVRPTGRKWWDIERLSAGCQMGNGFSTRCLRPTWPL